MTRDDDSVGVYDDIDGYLYVMIAICLVVIYV